MRIRTTALLIWLALGGSGCFVLARESYSSLRGSDALEIEPLESFEVSPGRAGHAISHSPSLARANVGPNARVSVAVCDWDPGVWFVVFPPLPLPLLSIDGAGPRPGTTLLRVSLDGPGTWRTKLGEIALVGAAGARSSPDRYKLVTRNLDDSLEPCSAEHAPRAPSDGSELAIFGRAELWLSFPTLDWPDTPRTLELRGLSLDGQPAAELSLELEPGSRWFWYRMLP